MEKTDSTYTFFNKRYGVEVKKGLSGKEKPLSGRIYLRFFPLEKGAKDEQIMVKTTASESFAGSLNIRKAIKGKKSVTTLIHKFESAGGTTTTSIKFDVWERNGRSGYGIAVARTINGKGKNMSVSLSLADMLFMAEILKVWAVESCYVKRDI